MEILRRASELCAMPDRTELSLRIDRRILITAASGAIRTGVPVRESVDGVFLIIDPEGRPVTVVASAVEAVLRDDYDRALSVCRYMAEKIGAGLLEDETAAMEEPAGRLRIFREELCPEEKTRPRFESRAAKKDAMIALSEDRGEGNAPEPMPEARKRFRPEHPFST